MVCVFSNTPQRQGYLPLHVWLHQGLSARRRQHCRGTTTARHPHRTKLTTPQKGLKPPYNWDEYAECFFPKALELTHTAEEAEAAGHTEKACEYYLRASAIYRIARFPAPRSPKQKYAWEAGKTVFYKGAALLEHPIREVLIPHHHRHPHEGATIPANLLVPPTASPSNPAPLVIIFTGLDGYRTELAVWQRPFLDRGIATLILEIPGTGDSPSDPRDPTSPDRQLSSILAFLGTRPDLDPSRVVVWGFSTGGYYALRAAHTPAGRAGLLGCVSLGGGCHHMFDRAWLERADYMEYPFDLASTLAYKFGYTLEEFFTEGAKFSLKGDGTLGNKCCRVLLVNGKLDEIFPIEDLYVALEEGEPKEARVVPGTKHMGEPMSFFYILQWIGKLVGSPIENPWEFLGGIPFVTKY